MATATTRRIRTRHVLYLAMNAENRSLEEPETEQAIEAEGLEFLLSELKDERYDIHPLSDEQLEAIEEKTDGADVLFLASPRNPWEAKQIEVKINKAAGGATYVVRPLKPEQLKTIKRLA